MHKYPTKLSVQNDISIWVGVIACWGSLQPWVMWKSSYLPFIVLMMFVCIRCLVWKGKLSWSSVIDVIFTLGFSFIYSQLFYTSAKGSLYQTSQAIIPILAFLTFSELERSIFLKRLINLFSVVGLISLVFFLLHFFVNLPFTISYHPNSYYPPFKNYLTFVVLQNGDLGWFTRFSSVYTEPGHLGMVSAILLYINGYTWKKWQNIVMTVCLIWSFSLAGFMLYFVGLVIYALAISKNIVTTLIKIIGASIILVVIGISFYSPTNDDIVSVKILSRLEIDDSNGIAGNSRNSINFDQYLDKVQSGSDKWLGIGRDQLGTMFSGTGNSSYKNYILGNGIVGTVGIVLLIGSYLFCSPSRKGFGLMILLIVSFIQRPYFLWAIESFPYLAALSVWMIPNEVRLKGKIKENLSIIKIR